MAREKIEYEDIPDEEESSDENEYNEEDYSYNSAENRGERTLEKPTLDKLLDTRGHIKAIEKQFKGCIEQDGRWVKVSPELARDIFIDKMMNGLRSVINEINIYTFLTEQQAEDILLEENIKFIRAALNERTIEDNDLRLIVDIYDHALQTFMGLPTKGHGSLVLRELVAGLSTGVEHLKTKSKNVLGEIGSLFTFGGNKKT